MSTKIYVTNMAIRISAAFAAGGRAVGQLWNTIGAKTNEFAMQVFRLFPKIQARPDQWVSTRRIDFILNVGKKFAQIEAKYRIPPYAGDALNRLVGQINAMVTYGKGQAVIWTLQQPTAAQLARVQQEVGPTVFNQVQFVHGIDGLYNWIVLFFGFQ